MGTATAKQLTEESLHFTIYWAYFSASLHESFLIFFVHLGAGGDDKFAQVQGSQNLFFQFLHRLRKIYEIFWNYCFAQLVLYIQLFSSQMNYWFDNFCKCYRANA